MIIVQIGNTAPMALAHLAIQKLVTVGAPQPTDADAVDFCFCDFECEWEQKVLAQNPIPAGGSARDPKNDYSSFRFKAVLGSDTIDMELYKGASLGSMVKVDDLDDATLGEFFDFGSLTGQPLDKGYVLEWDKVLSTHGPGFYQVRAQRTIVGNPSEFQSHGYRLFNYSDLIADGTVRYDTIQNGNILRSEFDYTGQSWPQSVRLEGSLGDWQPAFETDRYEDSNRKLTQIQDKTVNSYSLELEVIPSSISRLFMQDYLLANTALLSDYNLFNHEIYRKIELYPDEVDGATYGQTTKRGTFVVKMTDSKQDILKRNF